MARQYWSSHTERRLFLLATAFSVRGLAPAEALQKALYYTKGPGRRQNWLCALAEHDREVADRLHDTAG